MPEISASMLKKKLGNIERASKGGAKCVVANDLGCLMNMECAAKKAGMKVDFKHIAELFTEKSN